MNKFFRGYHLLDKRKMAKVQYELTKITRPELFPINLIKVTGDREFIATFNAFGPAPYDTNLLEMSKVDFNPWTGETINFRAPTTLESILIASYDFPNRIKGNIFLNELWLQIGRIVETTEGIFANPPKDLEGNCITDVRLLESYLNGTEPIKIDNGKIYIVQDKENLKDFGYAEYGTFKQLVQERNEFIESGLARVLEHTKEKAMHLVEFSDTKYYREGAYVNVFNYHDKGPKLQVVCLSSYNALFDIHNWCCDGYGGVSFGVFEPKMKYPSKDLLGV